MMNLHRWSLSILLATLLAGCGSSSLAPPPSPLPAVQNKLVLEKIWHRSLDTAVGSRLQPTVRGDVIAAISDEAKLSLLDVATGKVRWQTNLPAPAAGGAGVAEDLVVAATIKGGVLAFGMDGKSRWSTQLNNEISVPPVVAGGVVLIRGNDGRLVAVAADTGELKWTYVRQQPALLLRNFAAPLVVGSVVYYGQAGGRLAALDLKTGRVLWEAQVAQPHGVSEIERIADIVAQPVADDSLVCAIAYQGRLGCFNALNGTLVWSRDASSWSGLAMDAKNVYASDDKGYVIAYERSGGRNLWRQEKLFMRGTSGPALIGRTLAVGDFEGYVHFMDIEDGSFVAQQSTDGGAIVTAPRTVAERWLIQTQEGGLYLFGPK